MSRITIYHNPRCSKSRQTLALLRERDIEPEVVEYLSTPPDAATIKRLLKLLRLAPGELIRGKEFRALQLPATDDPDTLIAYMAAHPEIIERPIVVCGRRAVLGRPPENVLQIIE